MCFHCHFSVFLCWYVCYVNCRVVCILFFFEVIESNRSICVKVILGLCCHDDVKICFMRFCLVYEVRECCYEVVL